MSMRAGTLRTLLKELRAGGVSEFTETSPKGGTITLKLHRTVEQPASTEKASAKAAKQMDAEFDSKRRAILEELGTDEAGLRKVTEGLQ